MSGGQLFEKYKNNLIEYIADLKIHPNLKKEIGSIDFLQQNPPFYLYYPLLFSVKGNISEGKLNNLCIAGYLYYQSTLFLDELVDGEDSSYLILAMICQEEAIKILTTIFSINSDYWQLWNKRRNEFFLAIKIERKIRGSSKDISKKEYEELADYKSAFGKAAIDSLYILDKKLYKLYYERLIRSHRYFSVAFQINDDILDFNEDYENRQFNWAVQHAIKEYNSNFEDIGKLKKIFYINGTAKLLFLQALSYLDLSYMEVKQINVPLWKQEIKVLKQKLENSIKEIENYLEVLSAEVSLVHDVNTKNNLETSIKNAINYISTKQTNKGQWREFVNQGGISDIWSTAFISVVLLENKDLKKLFSKNLQKAVFFLKNSKLESLWGYNLTWIEDADTTNLAFLSLLFSSHKIDEKSLDKWLDFRVKNSGFSTYRDKEYLLTSLNDKEILDVSGWVSSHQCVSAVSFYFLVLYQKDLEVTIELGHYFDRLIANKEINSYWWTSKIYTYYFLAKAYKELKRFDKLELILDKISDEIDKNLGCIKDAFGENVFFTGMALETLLLSKNEYSKDIERLKEYLVKKQFSDGSWANSHSLRIPAPSSIEVDINEHYNISSHGTSVRAKEFNRLFTTVCALKGLFEYEKAITCS